MAIFDPPGDHFGSCKRCGIVGSERSEQLLLNMFFDQITPLMRKGRNGVKMVGKIMVENIGENSGPLTLLPVERLTATDCNASARANYIELK